jgi:hemoglobin
MPDIRNRADIHKIMSSFYQQLLSQSSINSYFVDIKNFDDHLEIIVSFWESVLLGTGNYQGNVMIKHLDLHRKYTLTEAAFDTWLTFFGESIETSGFHGDLSTQMLERAKMIASHMKYKIASLDAGMM